VREQLGGHLLKSTHHRQSQSKPQQTGASDNLYLKVLVFATVSKAQQQ